VEKADLLRAGDTKKILDLQAEIQRKHKIIAKKLGGYGNLLSF
jgi:hypothetical protein